LNKKSDWKKFEFGVKPILPQYACDWEKNWCAKKRLVLNKKWKQGERKYHHTTLAK